ncbi:methyl-accepting chemotaxis protein [Uliginosibacterium paludis]|uniref:Methyl-accepting chemotaxis protein n=1 Tax=Uliginosibacterium paludis TaxID=1615952 RepID=A0ABV2CNQ4_9RHOO
MTIARKLLAFILLALFTLILTLGVTLYENHQIKLQQEYISKTVLPSMRAFRDITEYVGEYRRLFTSFQRVVGTPEEKSLKVVEGMEETGARLQSSFAEYEKTVQAGEDRALFDKSLGYWKIYFATVQESLPISRSNDKEAMEAKRVIIRQAGADFFKALRAQVDYLKTQQDEAEQAMQAAQRNAVQVTSAVIVIAALLLGTLGWELFRTSVPPLKRMIRTIEQIRDERNLALRLQAKGADELATASRALNALLDGFAADFRVLREAGAGLQSAAVTLASTAGQVSETVATQSEASSSIAAATEELTVSIHHVAARALDSRKGSDSSGELAKSGVAIITDTAAEIERASGAARRTEELMGELQSRAAEVEKVVAVIRGLADQTNLLALNAAIEAARAGEQGRGFAVVADEVRKLAEDTTRATVSVTQSINNILAGTQGATTSVRETVASVVQGVTRTTEASGVIGQISEHAQYGVAMSEEIASALKEQTQAADSIARQIEQLAHMTDSNREASDRTSEAARSLNTMAAQLNSMVTRYRLEA